MSVPGSPGICAQRQWTHAVPAALKGAWVERGQACLNKNSPLIIIADGGYRWRHAENWGFARGEYSWLKGDTKVHFRLQKPLHKKAAPPSRPAEFVYILNGDEMRRYAIYSRKLREYNRCRQWK